MAGKNGHKNRLPGEAPKERDPWRDAAGRFLPGNPGGPGNPYVRELARWRMEIRRLTPRPVFEMAVYRLQAKAMGGHYPSLRLFLQYMSGDPDRSVDIDRLDLDELELAVGRLRAEKVARQAGVPLAEAPPTGIPYLPPPETPAPPPPPGRPEEEWRKAPREAPEATPPVGHQGVTPPWGDLMGRLHSGLGPDAFRHLKDVFHEGVDARPDAHSPDTKRPETARGEEGAPPEGGGLTGAD